jgi:hypothetical protein
MLRADGTMGECAFVVFVGLRSREGFIRAQRELRAMVTLALTDEQVVNLVQQLSPAQKRRVLTVLAAGAEARHEERMQQAERRLRELASARGLDWATMDEDAREVFIDDLLHEDD